MSPRRMKVGVIVCKLAAGWGRNRSVRATAGRRLNELHSAGARDRGGGNVRARVGQGRVMDTGSLVALLIRLLIDRFAEAKREAGSAKSKASKPASPAPRTSSPRWTRHAPARPRRSISGCPPILRSLDAPPTPDHPNQSMSDVLWSTSERYAHSGFAEIGRRERQTLMGGGSVGPHRVAQRATTSSERPRGLLVPQPFSVHPDRGAHTLLAQPLQDEQHRILDATVLVDLRPPAPARCYKRNSSHNPTKAAVPINRSLGKPTGTVPVAPRLDLDVRHQSRSKQIQLAAGHLTSAPLRNVGESGHRPSSRITADEGVHGNRPPYLLWQRAPPLHCG